MTQPSPGFQPGFNPENCSTKTGRPEGGKSQEGESAWQTLGTPSGFEEENIGGHRGPSHSTRPQFAPFPRTARCIRTVPNRRHSTSPQFEPPKFEPFPSPTPSRSTGTESQQSFPVQRQSYPACAAFAAATETAVHAVLLRFFGQMSLKRCALPDN